MKFTFELQGVHPQMTASTHPWNTETYDAPPREWNGSRAEILIVDCIDWDKETRREGETLTIEGDTAALRALFLQIVSLLDTHESYQKDHKKELAARSVLCPDCQRWNDPLASWHGDGKGKACYGLLNQRKALVNAEQPKGEGR